MRRELVFAGLLGAALALFLVEAWQPRYAIDDAFISYRYARNLAGGLGLVYNPGEYVEGFTNLLWTLLVAAGVALGGRAPGVGFALGLASGVLALVATGVYARALLDARHRGLAGLAPLLLLATPVFARWATSGLETPLFVALVAASLAAFARDRIGWASAGVAAATLCRPEGVLLAGTLYAFHLLPRWRAPRAWRAPLAYAAVLAALTLFRLLYYGSPLPNTFYAKVGGLSFAGGVEHVASFLASGVWLLLPPAVLALRDPRTRPGAVYAVLVAASVVWIGGDVFRWRFLLPAMPWLVGAALVGVVRLFRVGLLAGAAGVLCLFASVWLQSLGPLPPAALAGAALVTLGWGAALRTRAPLAHWLAAGLSGLALAAALGVGSLRAALSEAARHSERARYLAEVHEIDRVLQAGGRLAAGSLLARGEPIRLIAAGAIGSLGYYSRLPVLDLYGLVDATIARSRGDAKGHPLVPGHTRSAPDYVLERRPDYLFIRPREAGGGIGTPPAIRDLWAHPDLERLYVWDAEVGAYRRRGLRAAP